MTAHLRRTSISKCLGGRGGPGEEDVGPEGCSPGQGRADHDPGQGRGAGRGPAEPGLHRTGARTWCGSPTSPTCGPGPGSVYVAFIVDVFAQKIVAWHACTSKATDLVMVPLRMALWQRDREGHPVVPGELIQHSDAGSQYTSVRLTEHLALQGIRPSIGTVGDAYDNALMETISGLYKAECIRTTRLPRRAFQDPGRGLDQLWPDPEQAWGPRAGSLLRRLGRRGASGRAPSFRPRGWGGLLELGEELVLVAVDVEQGQHRRGDRDGEDRAGRAEQRGTEHRRGERDGWVDIDCLRADPRLDRQILHLLVHQAPGQHEHAVDGLRAQEADDGRQDDRDVRADGRDELRDTPVQIPRTSQ